jgi:hypothetical protein
MFKAKHSDFSQLSILSCFSVGDNPDGESYKYSPLMLINQIGNQITEKLTGYQKAYDGYRKIQIDPEYTPVPSCLLSTNSTSIYILQIAPQRCLEMIKWGWTITNEQKSPKAE